MKPHFGDPGSIVPPGRLCRLGIVVDPRWSEGRLELVARLAVSAGYGVLWCATELRGRSWATDVATVRSSIGATPLLVASLDDEDRPVAVVTASIGRTRTEAAARAEADGEFSSLVRPGDLHGMLEDCQARVIELAAAGVDDLALVVPDTPDIADVLAQLTAVNVGTTALVQPGMERSPDPEPPPWGARRH